MKLRFIPVFCIMAVLTHVANSAEPIGNVIALQGMASATDSDNVERELAIKGAIYLNDKIATSEGAKLQIMFDDESVVSQGENAEMLIDEYIYNPQTSEANSSMKLVKGIFRVVTGKITQLNPDRFKVKTRMATIGIRGCELGFKVSQVAEDIYIIEIHGQESVIVQARPNVGGGEWDNLVQGKYEDSDEAKKHLFNVTKPNRVISITQNEGSEERELTSAELTGLVEAVTPAPATEEESGETETESTEMGEGDGDTDESTAAEENTTTTDAENTDATTTTPSEETTTENEPSPVVEDVVADNPTDADIYPPDTGPALPDDTPDEIVVETQITPPPTFEDYKQVVVDTTPPPPDTTPPTDTTPSPTVTTPIEEETPVATGPDMVDSGGGTDWGWEIWEENGDPYEVTFFANSSSDIIDGSDFSALAAQSQFYNLTGAGDAAAIVSDGSVSRIVQGSCDMMVRVGNNYDPIWSGSFDMGSAVSGNALSFEADGVIQNNGALSLDGNPSSYSMKVDGATWNRGTLTSSDLSGNLVGPGAGAKPTGVVGSFDFQHTGGASANGGFGADLN